MMKRFSPFETAFEGLRVIRREPRSIVVWTFLWLALLSAAAIVLATGAPVVVQSGGPARNVGDISQQFGSFAVLFVPLVLLLWAVTTVATFRAVLEPERRRSYFLQLGRDELRLAIMTVAALALVLVFGGAPAFLLLALVSPLMAAVPTFARDIATIGAIVTVCLDVWLGIRLSLIAVETFAERRFHLTAYWPLARGRFWYLLASYAICFVILFAVLALFAVAGMGVEAAQSAIGAPVGADLVRRGALLALAGVLALLTAGFLVVSTTLFCACQAHAYRSVIGGLKTPLENI